MHSEGKTRDDLWKMIKDIRFGMLTTRHSGEAHDGHLHARPMTTQNKDLDDARLWFFMSRRSGPVDDIVADPTVNVSYAEPDDDTYVSVSGIARVIPDVAQARALWNKAADAWFPGGPEDPDLVLVAVDIEHAHYWDVKENKLTQLMVMAKAALTGEPPRLGESGEVRPSH
ncbi:MAG: pyridoxamine 5'-phosphate oxidase family protein [Hydrogenophaga sp.]|uniref:pyridoxamine 5'-phosphate oxidase family protein n=1 Tax=Hydrogenophaga sp. TaxID=1904254 RepID=UPI0016A5A0D6|nr:pyridoxamine 5'-phosphate oxidase family protein [Hydrogenophaga sp.]NIM43646.1 pyridoxamine 5'-phosphate oxidase family protein [Hydrogenophaga sp.]NIN28715.1 pyridoxamine 5'-phosphate oxidase family protein [Hydrogenophaga sp.]NIN33174.1 pyridoxamine 5'-phosphate oxidase family protein [Hydrogenophaga sp.]NIN57849.1 pyridoxamine 5'-phosphate oxidase family protein [Hydrogenophaga sp.]NIO54144.1 pyridoxamine 5'-phosphate oxidase family protein [Hydrogenophaga sp.]